VKPPAGKLDAALRVVLDALAPLPPLRWAAVRAQIDLLAAHPEMRDDVRAEIEFLLLLAPGPAGKHRAAPAEKSGNVYRLPVRPGGGCAR